MERQFGNVLEVRNRFRVFFLNVVIFKVDKNVGIVVFHVVGGMVHSR